MKPMRTSMPAALVPLMLWIALAHTQGQESAQTPRGTPQANASPFRSELVALQQVGSTSVNGLASPMWAIRIGDTEAAEHAAATSSRFLGANSIHGIVWVRDGESWIKATYYRPRSAFEFVDFLKNPRPFSVRQTGDVSILPFPFNRLNAKKLRGIDFIVTYFDGGTKAYIQSGSSEDEVTVLLQVISTLVKSKTAISDERGELP